LNTKATVNLPISHGCLEHTEHIPYRPTYMVHIFPKPRSGHRVTLKVLQVEKGEW